MVLMLNKYDNNRYFVHLWNLNLLLNKENTFYTMDFVFMYRRIDHIFHHFYLDR